MKKTRSELVLKWYQENKRILPWRESKNPYYIWVSEIMLQQTKVETVKPYFQRFIEALPTLENLASCSQDELMKLWQGLGYYRRAMNMQKAAIQCVENHQGVLPNNYHDLIQLSGIGEYTAGAVASIAFGESVYAIDGNVLRIYSRLYDIHKDILSAKTKKEIEQYVSEDINDFMGDYNQALMDIGATICTPTSPKCDICPLNSNCLARDRNTVNMLPVKKKKKKQKEYEYTIIVHVYRDQVLIRQRKNQGLLDNLYEFETINKSLILEDEYIPLGNYKHVFSHQIWNMSGYMIEEKEKIQLDDYQWVSFDDLQNYYSIPSAFLPFYKKIEERRNYHDC